MKTLLRLCILNAFIVWASNAFAEDVRDIPAGDDVIVSVRKDEPAPFAGQLFDINTSLRWANWLAQYKDKVAADAKKSKTQCESDLAYVQDLDDVDIARLDVLNSDLKLRLTRSEKGRLQAQHDLDNPAWYSSPWFGFVVGAVGTAGLIFAGSQIF